jgi:hypothetical protein
MNLLETQSEAYWTLCRLHRCSRWDENATMLMTTLLQSPYEGLTIRAADLWYRVSATTSKG